MEVVKVSLFIPGGQFDLQKKVHLAYTVKNNKNNSILNTKTHNKKQDKNHKGAQDIRMCKKMMQWS